MFFIIALFITIFMAGLSGDISHGLNRYSEQQLSVQQQSCQTVEYMNALNDYLYDHPMSSGVVSADLIPVKPPTGGAHIIQDSRVYVYQPDKKGLLWELEATSDTSALIGKVASGRLQDALGTDMGVSVSSVIPDGDVVYLD